MQSSAATVAEYLESLPPYRQETLMVVRKVILENLPPGYQEVMNWGMITYEIPLQRYPNTYNKKPLMYVGLASQKNHMAIYLMSIYGNQGTNTSFIQAYKESGKRLDIGKSCVRFKKIEDLPLDLIGTVVAATPVEKLIVLYETARK